MQSLFELARQDYLKRYYAPASTGNVSVGFDLLGAAFEPVNGELFGDVLDILGEAEELSLDIVGRYLHQLPANTTDNLVLSCFYAFEQKLGLTLPRLALRLHKNLPVGSGLGSSACSIVVACYAFNDYFGVVGKPFGQTNKPFFGISDGVVGVQWNLIVDTEKNTVELGVNLEGSEKMGGMLITDLLLARPSLTALKQACVNTPEIFLAIFRDAWQVSSRPIIEEQYVGGKLHSLQELNEQKWTVILDEALSCLEAEHGYRKRKRLQWVTLKTTGQKKQLDISPHLQIKTFINVDAEPYEAIKDAVEMLMPAREWVMQSIAEYQAATSQR